MTEMHRKAIKEVKNRVDELESDKRFLEKMVEKTRVESKKAKRHLGNETAVYDKNYQVT
jgi:hypothetical protein